jgi:hypothetical protein
MGTNPPETLLQLLQFPLKDAIHGKWFEDEVVITEVKRWLQQRPAKWYREGTQALVSRWRKAKDLGDYVEK